VIIVIGSKGNMGRRYCQILKEMGTDYKGIDLNETISIDNDSEVAGVIIATPTETHYPIYSFIRAQYSGRILCEKPFTTTILGCRHILSDNKLFIVNNYQYMVSSPDFPTVGKNTIYEYYNTGKDGIHLDCVQLYYLAKGKVEISKNSSIWGCVINGKVMQRQYVDYSYGRMINHFVVGCQHAEYDRIKYYKAHVDAIDKQRQENATN